MQFSRLGFVVFVALAAWSISCTKPGLIGSDFLEDEKANLLFSDAFGLTFHTEKTDSVLVHSDNISRQLATYLLGEVEDPIFGTYRAEIFAQPVLPATGTQLIGVTLDSVVLSLRYDTLGTYGTIEEPVTVTVYRMLENPSFTDEVFSNQSFISDPDPLGSLTFVPRPADSVTLNRPMDTVKIAPHIRIPIEPIKIQDLLMQDTVVFENQDSFLNYFNGLHISMTSGSQTMLGIDLLNAVSGLTFYYRNDLMENRSFQLIFSAGSIKTVYMQHDYTGTPVQDALGPDPETEYWYVQGLSGPTTRLEIDGIPDLGNVGINQATLEFYATFPPGDMEALYPACPYLVTQEMTDTSLINTFDVTIALNRSTGNFMSETYERLFGGKRGEPDPGPPVVYRYSMVVTALIQDIYAGRKQNVIYFNPFDKGAFPNRAVIFGPGHPDFAPRLNVHYTTL